MIDDNSLLNVDFFVIGKTAVIFFSLSLPGAPARLPTELANTNTPCAPLTAGLQPFTPGSIGIDLDPSTVSVYDTVYTKFPHGIGAESGYIRFLGPDNDTDTLFISSVSAQYIIQSDVNNSRPVSLYKGPSVLF